MRRRLAEFGLSVVAIVSLGFVAILMLGYVAEFGVRLKLLERGQSTEEKYSALVLGFGAVSFRNGDYFHRPVPAFQQLSDDQLGFHADWSFGLRKPDLRYSLWRFSAGSGGFARLLGRQYFIGFPIWCVLLPCLIAPIIWLRKRGPSKPVGFDVIASSN